MNKQLVDQNKAAFEYVYELQASGVTNMFGAVPYIRGTFPELSRAEASQILSAYMSSYEEIAAYLGIEV